MKKKVAVFIDWYEPGFKAGGPIQSCKNLVNQLSGLFEFYIFTSDRDIGEDSSYENVQTNTWIRNAENIHVWYATPDARKAKDIRSMIKQVQPDIVYFNSMFSKSFALIPLLVLKRIKYSGKIVLAPRGMLHSGALSSKSLKKKVFLQVFRLSGWPSRLLFHATDEQELKYVKKHFPSAKVKVAANIPNVDNTDLTFPVKQRNELNAVYIARIHPHKNLHFFLQLFKELKPEYKLRFDIFGVADDEAYSARCRELAADLPGNVQVNFHGPLVNREVLPTLKHNHVFMLATLGENFGHAVFESLTAGRPVLISDQTPWRSLASVNAGWDLPLNDKQAFAGTIAELMEMGQDEYDVWAKGAKALALDFMTKQNYTSTYLRLFNETDN
ncbi:MAG: glycosyltransferase family 4 protein [Chitinophagaceae bacterium]|nr:glycosyltransferase family 4 protein [Chitinophagaceae bacterium]